MPKSDETAEAWGIPSRIAAQAIADNITARLTAAGVPSIQTIGA